MAKILSPKEAKLQKALVPLNIIVFIICIVVVYSLIFTPLIKFDVGKVLRDKQVIAFVEEVLKDKLSSASPAADASKERDGASDFNIDFTPIISTTVGGVLGKAKGEITFSTVQVCRYSLDPRENKLSILLDDFLAGEKGLVNSLVTSLGNGIKEAISSEAGKKVVEGAVVDSLISSMGTIISNVGGNQNPQLTEAINKKLTPDKVNELKDVFFEMNTAKTEEDVVEIIDKFVNNLDETLGTDVNISEADRAIVKDYVVDLYNETMANIKNSENPDQNFSIESMVCIAAQKNIPIDNIDISQILNQYLGQIGGGQNGGQNGKPPVKKSLTEGENTPATSSDKPILSYSQLFGEMGFDEEKINALSASLGSFVSSFIDNGLAGINETLMQVPVYKYVYLIILSVLGFFILLWFMLALTALIRVFTKNKRYSMWYVKAIGFVPALIFLLLAAIKIALLFAPDLLKPLISSEVKVGDGFSISADTIRSFVMVGLGSVSTGTWICGAGYLALWILSFIWMYPVKRRIRKERKACKKSQKEGDYAYSNFESDYGYSVTDGDSYSGDLYDSDFSDDYSDTDDDYTKEDYSFNDDDF